MVDARVFSSAPTDPSVGEPCHNLKICVRDWQRNTKLVHKSTVIVVR